MFIKWKNSAVLNWIIKLERSAESEINCLKIKIQNYFLTLFPLSPLGPFSPLSPWKRKILKSWFDEQNVWRDGKLSTKTASRPPCLSYARTLWPSLDVKKERQQLICWQIFSLSCRSFPSFFVLPLTSSKARIS